MYLGQIHTGQEAVDYYIRGIEVLLSALNQQMTVSFSRSSGLIATLKSYTVYPTKFVYLLESPDSFHLKLHLTNKSHVMLIVHKFSVDYYKFLDCGLFSRLLLVCCF